jgi:two-component system phosphate regulon response regulator PhoB
MTINLLLVEDESAVRDMLRFALAGKGYQLIEAANARQGYECLGEALPDLVLLDWMLPDSSGIEFARRMRREPAWQQVPIIMLTARAEEGDKVRGLEAGADDYVTKPFSVRELQARMQAVLRRLPAAMDEPMLEFAGMTMDMEQHRVSAAGQSLQLGPTEFRLLQFFLTHPERVHSRTQLLDNVWGQNVYVDERTVDVHIRRLRKALAVASLDKHIQTVRGFGYRFSERLEA